MLNLGRGVGLIGLAFLAACQAKPAPVQQAPSAVAAPPAPPPPAVTPPPVAPPIEQPAQPPAPTNPTPTAAVIKGDLVGQQFQTRVAIGLIKTYTIRSLAEFISFKVTGKEESGNRVEYSTDMVLRKEAGSSKRCFATARVAYARGGPSLPWFFREMMPNTFTCE